MTNRNVNARLTYLGASVESSLYRNGKVFTQRDREGNDGAYHGVVTEQRDVVINDARRLDQSSGDRSSCTVSSCSSEFCSALIYSFSITDRWFRSTTRSVPRSSEKPQMRHRPLRSITISDGPPQRTAGDALRVVSRYRDRFMSCMATTLS